jgi:hypothetical protein
MASAVAKARAANKRKGGIHLNPAHKGLLHRKLGIAQGKPIPESRIESAENSNNPDTRREAVFAENARHFHHGGH